jgi:hypothetical protein
MRPRGQEAARGEAEDFRRGEARLVRVGEIRGEGAERLKRGEGGLAEEGVDIEGGGLGRDFCHLVAPLRLCVLCFYHGEGVVQRAIEMRT